MQTGKTISNLLSKESFKAPEGGRKVVALEPQVPSVQALSWKEQDDDGNNGGEIWNKTTNRGQAREVTCTHAHSEIACGSLFRNEPRRLILVVSLAHGVGAVAVMLQHFWQHGVTEHYPTLVARVAVVAEVERVAPCHDRPARGCAVFCGVELFERASATHAVELSYKAVSGAPFPVYFSTLTLVNATPFPRSSSM